MAADGTVAITAGTGTPIRVVTSAGPNNADQQVMTLADSLGNLNPAFPDGSLGVDTGSSSLFMEAFDSGISAWTTGGTVTPTASGGNGTFTLATTISASSFATSKATFSLPAQAYLKFGFGVQHEATATTNNARWWGYGVLAGSPTAAAPITNGVVFMLDPTAGALMGAVYSAGVRTQTVTLTRQSDAAVHRYQIFFKQSRAYFEIDGVVVGSLAWPNMAAVQNLSVIIGSFNSTSAASQAPTLVVGYASVADTGENNHTISDGSNPYVKATVKATPTTALATTDSALLVQAVPNASQASSTLSAVATAVTLTLAAPGAGLRHYITGIWFERYISVATSAAASAFASTSANTGLVFQLPSDAVAIGTVNFPVAINFPSPVASTAQNTATTFTAPAVTGTQYRISVTYFIAP